MINVISAVFRGAQSTTTRNAYQYDYGQVLKTNLALPETYEVQFSNNSSGGVAITQIGNADGVTIPDQMFISGAPIYAWIFLHQGADDGETVYFITIPVTKRAKPTSKQPTPVQKDAITQAIAALNSAVEQTGQDVTDAAASASAALASERAAAASEENAAASERAAALSETNAGNSATAAGQSATAARQSELNASGSASSASSSAAAAYADAERAEQAAATAGYLDVEIVDGDLIYTRTDAVDVDFELVEGNLVMEAV